MPAAGARCRSSRRLARAGMSPVTHTATAQVALPCSLGPILTTRRLMLRLMAARCLISAPEHGRIGRCVTAATRRAHAPDHDALAALHIGMHLREPAHTGVAPCHLSSPPRARPPQPAAGANLVDAGGALAPPLLKRVAHTVERSYPAQLSQLQLYAHPCEHKHGEGLEGRERTQPAPVSSPERALTSDARSRVPPPPACPFLPNTLPGGDPCTNNLSMKSRSSTERDSSRHSRWCLHQRPDERAS